MAVRYVSWLKSLDGTNDDLTQLTGFEGRIVSLTIIPNTTTIAVSFQATQDQAFVQLVQGRAITLSEPGKNLDIARLILRAGSAVTVSLLAAIE